MTAGNKEKRYIGRTDEPLCPEGMEILKALSLPEPEKIYVSPMRRCIETAQICYPGHALFPVTNFRECDFGQFKGKNYRELGGNTDYQRWIDSGGLLPFPNGEEPAAFRARCADAFADIAHLLLKEQIPSAAFVVHGGTIMAILERFVTPQKPFYDWKICNGNGYSAALNDKFQLIVKDTLW